jgi:hypothetical protein
MTESRWLYAEDAPEGWIRTSPDEYTTLQGKRYETWQAEDTREYFLVPVLNPVCGEYAQFAFAEAVSKGQAEALDRIRRADSTNSGVGGVVWWMEAQA